MDKFVGISVDLILLKMKIFFQNQKQSYSLGRMYNVPKSKLNNYRIRFLAIFANKIAIAIQENATLRLNLVMLRLPQEHHVLEVWNVQQALTAIHNLDNARQFSMKVSHVLVKWKDNVDLVNSALNQFVHSFTVFLLGQM